MKDAILIARTPIKGAPGQWRELKRFPDGTLLDCWTQEDGRRIEDPIKTAAAIGLYESFREQRLTFSQAFGKLADWTDKEILDEVHRRKISQLDLIEKTLSQCTEEEIVEELHRRISLDGWDPAELREELEAMLSSCPAIKDQRGTTTGSQMTIDPEDRYQF